MKQQVVLCLVVLCVSLATCDGPAESGPDAGKVENIHGNVGKDAGDSSKPQPTKPQTAAASNETDPEIDSCRAINGTCTGNYLSKLYEKGTLQRAFYVIVGITIIIVLYFVIKTVRYV